MTSVSKIAAGLAATTLAVSIGFGALAQDKKATTPAKTPAVASACKGLDEAACKGKSTECSWIGASKTKEGKDRKAYCRAKPKPKAKAATPAK